MPTMTPTSGRDSNRKGSWWLSSLRSRSCWKRQPCNYWRPLWIWSMAQAQCLSGVTSNASRWNSRSGRAVDSKRSELKRRPACRSLFVYWVRWVVNPLYTLFDLQYLELEFTAGGLRLDHVSNLMIHQRSADGRF